MLYAMGRSPRQDVKEGVTTDGIVLYLASDKQVYSRYDSIIFFFSIVNKRGEKLMSEKIFSDYVEPTSAVALIALDREGNRYSGYGGNRTDPGEEFDHYAITIMPKKILTFNLFHRELREPLYESDKSFTHISDRPGTYTINALIQKDFLNTNFPLVSNKITIIVNKK